MGLRVGAGIAIVGFVFSAGAALGQAQSAVERGKALLEANCARCHATGMSGDSPLAKAPLFRELNRRYPVESLAEALAEGIVTGHSDMPQFAFEPAAVNAIIAYLKSISG